MRGIITGGTRRAVGALSVVILMTAGLLGTMAPPAGAPVVSGSVVYNRLDSQSTSGANAASDAYTPATSASGLITAFITPAGLAATDTNGQFDVYRHDATTGNTDLVSTPDGSTAMAGNPSQTADATLNHLDISDDGSKVFFLSDYAFPGVPLGSRNLYVKDFATNGFALVNVNDTTGSTVSLLGTGFFAASGDGTKVAFLGQASSGESATQGIYIRDLTAGTTSFAYFADAAPISMSGDGTHVAFERDTPSGVGPGCPTGLVSELYIWHFDTANNISVSVLANAGTSSNFCDYAGVLGPNSLNNDGTVLAFWSDGNAFVNNSTGGPAPRQIFRFTDGGGPGGIIQSVSTTTGVPMGNADSAPAAGGFQDPRYPAGAISSDGTVVAFASSATNLDPDAANGAAFVKDFTANTLDAKSVSDIDWAAYPVTDTTLSSSGNYITFSTPTAITPADADANIDVFTRDVDAPTAPPAPAPTNVQLDASTEATYPGFSFLNSSNVPAAALPLDALGDVAGAPLRSINLASSPLRSIPLRSIPLRSIPLRSIPLRSITLSEIPLVQGTWEAILATIPGDPYKGVPLQNISLDEVLASSADMSSVTLGNVDLASTPLRSISVSSILLGSTPLRSIGNGIDWCATLASLGYSCAALGVDVNNTTLLALDLAGVPLRSIPLRSIPLRSIPLRSIDLASSPLRSIPLRSIKFAGDLGAMGLEKIGTLNPNGTLASSNPGLLVNCLDTELVTCTGKTLADATTADAFLAGKTFGDLADHVDLNELGGTLGDLIAAMIDTTNYPWESLPLDGLQPYGSYRSVNFTASFDVSGVGSTPASVAVDLPPGFVYQANSAWIDDDANYVEPVVTGGTHLAWIFPVSGGTSHAIHFTAYPGFDLTPAAGEDTALRVTIGANEAVDTDPPVMNVIEDFETAPIITIAAFDSLAACYSCGSASFAAGPGYNDSPFGAVQIQPNQLVTSHIGRAGDVDYFKIPVPPKGTRMQIKLGNHSTDADFDVAMINSTTSAPLRSIPLRSIPLRSIPLADNGVDAQAADSSLSPETLNDIPNVDSTPLRSIGENRGTANEFLATVSDADPLDAGNSQQYYLLQVTAYNGGSSLSPYTLYVQEYAPPPPPVCPSPKAFAFGGQGVAGTAPASIPSDVNTLFLVNKKRLGDTWGATAANDVMTKLNTLAGSSALGVSGVVYPVESDSAAAGAYGAWDSDPCDPEKANAVFNAVGEIVDSVRSGHEATLKNIVVVGGDDIVPMARVADYTQISNESDYAASTLLTTGANRGTPIAAAEATQNILTDDPLGDVDPIPWLDHQLFVPDLAIGRMVETPAEIIGQVDQFIAAQGKLSPATSLTTGYDFLADGADAVDTALAGGVANRSKIVNETWSKADVLAALYPAGGSPQDVISMNAHYDHSRSLPALGNSTGDESDLVTTDDIAAHPNTLTKRLIFTMGCHAGLSVPKSYTDTAAKDKDWAQAYSANKAAVYLANTGFGYGDTAAVALSEELMRQFASRLNGTMTVGQAAIYAKQAYFGQLGAYGPYDEKAMQEATFYGLPMWQFQNSGAPQNPANITPDAADANGVSSHSVTLGSTFTKKTSKGGGSYFTATAPGVAASGLQVTQYRPVEPRLSVDVTPGSGGKAHGVLITDLVSHDMVVVPAMARPVIDLTGNEPPPPAGDVSFPTNFQNLTTFNTPTGERQHVVFLPGQFFRDASSDSAGGVQRLFDSISADVKYSESDDFLAPLLTDVDAVLAGGNLTISLKAVDSGDGAVTKVLVLVKAAGSPDWSPLELTDPESDGTYSGVLAVGSQTQFEYFAQAEDDAGNVGVTTNKGRYFTGKPAPLTSNGTPNLALTPGQPTGSNGWYKGNVTVSLNGTPGVSYTQVVDDNPGGTFPTILTTDGAHSVKALGSDGSSATAVVVIDKTAPTYSAVFDRAPNGNGWYNAPVKVTTSCSDATSGVQVCPPTRTLSNEGASIPVGDAFDFAGNTTLGPIAKIDTTAPGIVVSGVTEGAEYTSMPTPTCTSTDALSGPDTCTGSITGGTLPGQYVYTGLAKDKAGNTFAKQVTFKIKYLFSGFLQPVNDTGHYVGTTAPPYSVFAGNATVPLKFYLYKPDGTKVQANSVPTFLTPIRRGPISGAPINEATETTVPTPGWTFTYDAANGTYSFNWKADKKTYQGYYWEIGALIDGAKYTVIIGVK